MAHTFDFFLLTQTKELCRLPLNERFEGKPPNVKFNKQKQNHCRTSSGVKGKHLRIVTFHYATLHKTRTQDGEDRILQEREKEYRNKLRENSKK